MRILALVIASAVLLLTGCSEGKSLDSPNAVVTVTAEPEVMSDEDVFLDVVRDEYPILVGMEDKTIIDLVEASCGMLDVGASIEDVLMVVSEGATTEQGEVMAFVIGAGVVVYCPEHQDAITGSGYNA